MQTLITGVESEIVHLARVARERYEAGRTVGVALAAVTVEATDPFLLDLGEAPEYTGASAADWVWYLNR